VHTVPLLTEILSDFRIIADLVDVRHPGVAQLNADLETPARPDAH
jgi:hypothetical protein